MQISRGKSISIKDVLKQLFFRFTLVIGNLRHKLKEVWKNAHKFYSQKDKIYIEFSRKYKLEGFISSIYIYNEEFKYIYFLK